MSKIFGKIKRGKIIIALLFVVMVTSLIIALAGCSDSTKKSNMTKYGNENAYNTTSSSAIIHAPSSVSYYIDSSVTGNYKTAATYAINEADGLTDAVTISKSSKSSSSFVIKVANLGKNSANAVNTLTYNASTGLITSSTITLNSYYMSSYSLNGMKHIMLHEIGHTFGLVDYSNSKAAEYTVMYYSYSTSSTYTFVTYQEFDENNIAWYYG